MALRPKSLEQTGDGSFGSSAWGGRVAGKAAKVSALAAGALIRQNYLGCGFISVAGQHVCFGLPQITGGYSVSLGTAQRRGWWDLGAGRCVEVPGGYMSIPLSSPGLGNLGIAWAASER